MIPLRKSRSTSTRFVVVRVVVAVFYALGLHFMSCITCSQSIDLLFPFAAFLWLICFPGKFIWRSCSHGTKLSYLCGSAIPHGLIDKVIVFSSLFGGRFRNPSPPFRKIQGAFSNGGVGAREPEKARKLDS